jgi:hypothetical protein
MELLGIRRPALSRSVHDSRIDSGRHCRGGVPQVEKSISVVAETLFYFANLFVSLMIVESAFGIMWD